MRYTLNTKEIFLKFEFGVAVMLQLCCNDTCAERDLVTPSYDACYSTCSVGEVLESALWLKHCCNVLCVVSGKAVYSECTERLT